MTSPLLDIAQIEAAHAERWGRKPDMIVHAPGRINLIGEHTDYNGGFVMPCAIDRGITVSAHRTGDVSQLESRDLGIGQPFEVSTVEPADVSGWVAYAAGMAWVLREHGALSNIEATIHSNLPMGSGVSSSAAMELAFGRLWNALGRLIPESSSLWKSLALLGQKCENKFVGVNCGVMDQMASSGGKADHALFIDTRSLDTLLTPMPSEYAVVLCDTKKPRALTDSAYNERRSQCEAAANALGVQELRDASLELLMTAKPRLTDVIFRRAKHVITENERTLAFVEALAKPEPFAIGNLMKWSHESLRDDYEVSCRELDVMAESAWTSRGCIGARMTGAGFGGACVALVQADRVSEFCADTIAGYARVIGTEPELVVTKASDGARILNFA